MQPVKKLIIFSTQISNLKKRDDGSSVNDFKLLLALKKNFNVYPIFRDYDPNYSLIKNLIAILRTSLRILKISFKSNQTIILRGTEMNFIPCFLKKFRNHKIILSLGCTPVIDIETKAFERNPEFNHRINKLKLFLINLIQNYQFKQADKIIVENTLAEKIVKKVIPENLKVYIVPYYVNHYFMNSSNPPYSQNSKEIFKLAYTGRFASYDKLNPIIDTIRILNERNFRVKMILIGDGKNRDIIQQRIIRTGLNEYFEFRGSMKHNELAKNLNEFHCLILPMVSSISPSTIAIKILEGVMSKKVVITTNSGNNKSLFPSNYDLIIPKVDISHLKNAIEKAMVNYDKYAKMMEENFKEQLNHRSFAKIQKLLKYIIEA